MYHLNKAEELATKYFKGVRYSQDAFPIVLAEISRLLESFEPEEIELMFNYLVKNYPHTYTTIFMIQQKEKELDVQVSLHRIKKYKSKKEAERKLVNYDSKNRCKEADKPNWFGKGIDYDLFK